MPGPYVQMALICEKVLQEPDGVMSIIRAVDRLTLTAPGDAPEQLPEGGAVPLTIVVALKADDAQGRYQLGIGIEMPSGESLPEQTFDVMLEGGERGINAIINTAVPAMEGLYWFNIRIAETRLSRIPLRIIYQRAPLGA